MSETTTITAQVPTDLRDEINRIADAEHRSASGQIRLFLESCIADYKAGTFPNRRAAQAPTHPRPGRRERAA